MKKFKLGFVGFATCLVAAAVAVKEEYDAQKREQEIEDLQDRVSKLEKERAEES